MIMAIGAGEKRPYVVDDALANRYGHVRHRQLRPPRHRRRRRRAADEAFKTLVENPLGLVA
jgi:pyruvate dehydrogenase E2 component (dihydrolipoamide acetyltransferase)